MPKPIDYDSPAVMAEARRKLAEMYASEDTAGRTQLGRDIGYKTGKPVNIRRSVRRLARARLGIGQKENLDAYFKDYVTYGEDPRRHDRVPPYSIEGNAQIHAFVMQVDGDGGTYTSYMFTGGSNSIQVLFDEFTDEVLSRFSDDERYKGLLAIAFTPAGIAELSKPVDKGGWGVVPPREPDHNYGITLHNTRFAYVDKKRQGQTPPTMTGRQFPNRPKGRRKKMIQFINRSYGQRNRRGATT